MLLRPTLVFALLLVVWSCSDDNSPSSPPEDELTFIDAHSQPPYPELGDNVDLTAIINAMDENDVAVSILSARQEMRYSMDIASLAAAHPDRIVAAVSLKLITMDASDQGFLSALAQQVESGQFDAIAEMLLYHAEKFDGEGNSSAPEVFRYPSASTVQAVIDAAEQLDCPVVLHIEFASLEIFYGADERARFLTELEQLLTASPTREFVLTHVAELSPDQCRSLIEAHSNVYFTTNFGDLKILMTGVPVGEYSETDWIDLFEDHPDRFVFAFDRVFQNQWELYAADMASSQDFLAKVSELVAQALAYDNAARLWDINP
jgi:predicted TIM-barrel fold metal-dependent hydrolase